MEVGPGLDNVVMLLTTNYFILFVCMCDVKNNNGSYLLLLVGWVIVLCLYSCFQTYEDFKSLTKCCLPR